MPQQKRYTKQFKEEAIQQVMIEVLQTPSFVQRHHFGTFLMIFSRRLWFQQSQVSATDPKQTFTVVGFYVFLWLNSTIGNTILELRNPKYWPDLSNKEAFYEG